MISLHEGDNRDHLRRMIDDGVRVHAVVTDPPYGLVSIAKRFGTGKAASTAGNDRSFARLSGGFMGKAWDATGIERDPEFWRLIHDILLPGGCCFAFSGSRTGHWQACAMEQAGFIMHPMHGWVFGSGFPKAHDAAKAVDRAMGEAGEIVPAGDPVKRMIPGADQHRDGSWEKNNGRAYQPGSYVPASDEAAAWDGWKYGTQTQKPALEPIYLGQRPFDQKNGAENLLKHGVGAFNVDGCRVCDVTEDTDEPSRNDRLGRYPANLIHDGSDEVTAMFPASDGQAGAVRGTEPSRTGDEGTVCYGEFSGDRPSAVPRGDSGSAARLFNTFPPDADPIFYNGKAGAADRAGSRHPTVKPVALIQHLIRHITPPGGVVLDPFGGSGTTGEAARREGVECILMEQEPDYAQFIRERFMLSGATGAEIGGMFGPLDVVEGEAVE